MPSVQSHNTSIYYEVYGNGPVLVFGHGAGGNVLSWFQQVPEFSRTYKVIVFDHRGWGRSFCDPAYVHAAYFADDLRQILDTEGVRHAAIVGHSLGTWTGLRAAIEYPDRVNCLVLSGDTGGVLTPTMVQAMREFASGLVGKAHWWERLVSPSFREREPALAFLHDQIQALNPPLDAAKMEQTLDLQVRTEELVGYDIPTLLLVGELDSLLPPEVLRGAAAVIPGLKIYNFENAGNSPHFEAPCVFNQVVREFIEQHQ